MAKYRMEDGTILSTEKALESWKEEGDWNGSNYIGRSSNSQWHDHTLHKSVKGRYWLEMCSRVQGTPDRAEYMSEKEAAAWLLHNEHELPEDLAELENEVEE